MQIFYSLDNVRKRYWAWCARYYLRDNLVYYYNCVTGIEGSIVCRNSFDAKKIYKSLYNGILFSDLIDVMNNCGLKGREIYVYLMKSGIIE